MNSGAGVHPGKCSKSATICRAKWTRVNTASFPQFTFLSFLVFQTKPNKTGVSLWSSTSNLFWVKTLVAAQSLSPPTINPSRDRIYKSNHPLRIKNKITLFSTCLWPFCQILKKNQQNIKVGWDNRPSLPDRTHKSMPMSCFHMHHFASQTGRK